MNKCDVGSGGGGYVTLAHLFYHGQVNTEDRISHSWALPSYHKHSSTYSLHTRLYASQTPIYTSNTPHPSQNTHLLYMHHKHPTSCPFPIPASHKLAYIPSVMEKRFNGRRIGYMHMFLKYRRDSIPRLGNWVSCPIHLVADWFHVVSYVLGEDLQNLKTHIHKTLSTVSRHIAYILQTLVT